jgi:hypothetical protein
MDPIIAQSLRIVCPGALYHIAASGNERKAVVRSKRDHEKFVRSAVGQEHDSALKEGWVGIARQSELSQFHVEGIGFDCIVEIRQDRRGYAKAATRHANLR